ncbi:thiol reductant ABC exporter subunit CydD [Trueperella bialowiezensis]|uniref:ATP-binding/permease protein CydD n=1 Tax=Trueperella bialowiezensis TaxID=312285 RepID=A0A448PGK3_9ACTO|nr:thiol reductant ABC exporter subunit CydD [Trueperella bialowiezensis]VEI14042.1 ATP-binding/permease protein CydD [Trueperella bialowiezensis]
MKPFDPRLMRYARATRTYIAFLVLLGIVDAALIAVQIVLIAKAVSPVFYGTASPAEVMPYVGWLAVVFAVRFAFLYVRDSVGHRAAINVITDLRGQVLDHAAKLGDRWLSGNTTNTVTLATRGLDDLEDYFVNFLPQLFLCVTAGPALTVLLAKYDTISALFVVFCVPLIPIFMILIGKMTARYSNERLGAMQQLSAQLLDLLAGLATLKGLGREKGPEKRVKSLGQRFAQKTMQTLYVAFLSGAALEFLATLSTALVAVNIGLRMVGGTIPLEIGLIVIMLTPEIFKPLREVGTQFHASSNGMAAAERAFTVLETPIYENTGTAKVPDLSASAIRFDDVSVYAPGRSTVAPANLTASIEPGQITVLRGPSGSGKTTAVQVLLGLLEPDEGEVSVGGVPLSDIDRDQWWEHISWVPQRPAIVPGTVAENVGGSDDAAQAAAELTGFADVVAALPDGWNTRIGHGGTGLSVGQRQRLALTRALISSKKIVVLDEPSAHLDAMSEEYVTNVVRTLKNNGHTVVVIAHRAAISQLADTVIDVEPATRDISAELREAAAIKESADVADFVEAQRADYAIPQDWLGANASGHKVVKLAVPAADSDSESGSDSDAPEERGEL